MASNSRMTMGVSKPEKVKQVYQGSGTLSKGMCGSISQKKTSSSSTPSSTSPIIDAVTSVNRTSHRKEQSPFTVMAP
jgi:hypothetical protein